jgi:hypothetical protein
MLVQAWLSTLQYGLKLMFFISFHSCRWLVWVNSSLSVYHQVSGCFRPEAMGWTPPHLTASQCARLDCVFVEAKNHSHRKRRSPL